jgi:hypothetical protein
MHLIKFAPEPLGHCGNASPLTRRALNELDDDGITDVAIDQAPRALSGNESEAMRKGAML